MAVIDLWYKTEKVAGPDGKPVLDEDGNPLKRRVRSRRYGRGRRWRVDWEDPTTKKPLTKSFENKKGPGGAEEWDKQVGADISRNVYVDIKAGEIPVSEYGKKWRDDLVHDGASADVVERFFRLHVDSEALGDIPVGSVLSSDIQAWIKSRSEVLSPETLSDRYKYLVSMFMTLQDDKIISSSPCTKRITLPERQDETRYIPTPAEVLKLQEELDDRLGPIVILAASTGLRAGEIFGLEPGNVDFEKGRIFVCQQIKKTSDYGVHIARPKTKTSRRYVEIPDGLRDPLREFIARERKPLKLWDRCDRRQSKHFEREVDLVFRAASGGTLNNGTFHYPWIKAVNAVGLQPGAVGLHSMRHYFATVLIHNGKNVKTVQMALGHSKPTVTLDTYTHEWPEEHEHTRDLLQSNLFGQ